MSLLIYLAVAMPGGGLIAVAVAAIAERVDARRASEVAVPIPTARTGTNRRHQWHPAHTCPWSRGAGGDE